MEHYTREIRAYGISVGHAKAEYIWKCLPSAIEGDINLFFIIMDQRTFIIALCNLINANNSGGISLYKVDGSIMLFQIKFHILLWFKVSFIFYYGYKGFGDRPKSASFSIFFDVNVGFYY